MFASDTYDAYIYQSYWSHEHAFKKHARHANDGGFVYLSVYVKHMCMYVYEICAYAYICLLHADLQVLAYILKCAYGIKAAVKCLFIPLRMYMSLIQAYKHEILMRKCISF
jgi:hypothetical protein